MKTIIVLASHGAPATDCPRSKIGMLMALESMHRLVDRFAIVRRLENNLDRQVRTWPRTPANDPYKNGVEVLARHLAARTGWQVIAGYNEFCAPTIAQAIDQAVAAGAGRVIVVSTMTTSGGEHSEIDIRDNVVAAGACHPGVQIFYAWPFDPDRIAQLFAEEITRLTQHTAGQP